MKSLKRLFAFAILAYAVLSLTGCASMPKPFACQQAPQFFANDAQGHPASAISLCFGKDHEVLWSSRPMTQQEVSSVYAAQAPKPAAAAPAPAAPAKIEKKPRALRRAPDGQVLADQCAELTGADYTDCRMAQKAAEYHAPDFHKQSAP